MKKTLASAAMFLAMTAAANAGTITTPSGHYLWQGDMFIISNNNPAVCASLGDNVGKFAQAVFAPKNALNDPTQDKLVIYPSDQLSVSQWVSNNNAGLINNAKSVTSSGINSRRLLYRRHNDWNVHCRGTGESPDRDWRFDCNSLVHDNRHFEHLSVHLHGDR